MFLYHCAHGLPYSLVEDRFDTRSSSVSECINAVADVMKDFGDHWVCQLPNHDSMEHVHNEFADVSAYFDGCLGAFNGTFTPFLVGPSLKHHYKNRKEKTTTNICMGVDMNKRVIFVCGSHLGSYSDSTILKECRDEATKFPHSPPGAYCFSFNYK